MLYRNAARAIIVKNECLLVIEAKGADGEIFYVLPGGGQNPGELLHDTLRRELLEEINAEVAIGGLRFVREHLQTFSDLGAQSPNFHQVEFLFECEVADGYEISHGTSPDCYQQSVRWLPVESLEDVSFYPQQIVGWLQNGLIDDRDEYIKTLYIEP